MQVAAVTRRAVIALKPHTSLFHFRTFTPHHLIPAGTGCANSVIGFQTDLWVSKLQTASFCSVPLAEDGDAVKELHDKVLESIKVKRSAPPNAWLWSMIEKCKTEDDIKLLFSVMEQYRIFRLSNLRIPDNFNLNLCREVTKACIRSAALNFGKKTIWKHNVYGLTPTIGSANQLLLHAKEQKDIKLMIDIMRQMKKNDLPLQPATADIVFSICDDANHWELISKFAEKFVKAGVKLRKTTFDIWLGFASRKGDLESLWKIEKSRSEIYDKHTIRSAFSCCKGLLLERKPKDAASLLQEVTQNFPDSKRQDILAELHKLINEWPAEIIKSQKRDDKKASLITSLKADIPAMINSLSSLGIDSRVSLEDINIA